MNDRSLCFFITQFQDPRIVRLMESIQSAGGDLSNVIIADGGMDSELRSLCEGMGVQIVVAPGSVAETRAQAFPHVGAEWVAFLDTDMVVTTSWLKEMQRHAVQESAVDVWVAPTHPVAEPRTKTETDLNAFEAWFYPNVVAVDPVLTPMGGTVWRTATLNQAGGFDPRFTMGGEDIDVNIRALAIGAKFGYLAEVSIGHDQSGRLTPKSQRRRARKYQVGAALAYMKNGILLDRLAHAAKPGPVPRASSWASKPLALLQAYRIHRQWERRA